MKCAAVIACLLAVAVEVALAKRSGKHCRFVDARGRLGRPASCARPRFLAAKGVTAWSLTLRRPPAGRYEFRVRARDRAGNATTTNPRRLTIRHR